MKTIPNPDMLEILYNVLQQKKRHIAYLWATSGIRPGRLDNEKICAVSTCFSTQAATTSAAGLLLYSQFPKILFR